MERRRLRRRRKVEGGVRSVAEKEGRQRRAGLRLALATASVCAMVVPSSSGDRKAEREGGAAMQVLAGRVRAERDQQKARARRAQETPEECARRLATMRVSGKTA